jgi:hypothetical protein
MEPLVVVHHCLLVRDGKKAGPLEYQQYTLRGVSYHYKVPADTEFPTDARPPWAVYLRLTGRSAGPTRVLFTVHYQNPRQQWQETSRLTARTNRPLPFPDDDDETRDEVLNLPYLGVGGVGLHALTVHFRGVGEEPGDGWEQEDEGREPPVWGVDPEELFGVPGWTYGATEYFWIVRAS